ncbi:MAG: trypsin-like peptidase domain-containing protein [Isosphaeraceae bacterium]
MELNEVYDRLAVIETLISRFGIDLGETRKNLERSPSATCVQVGVAVEYLLRDLWVRLQIKGSPDRRQLEDLLTMTTRKMEDVGPPMPPSVVTQIRQVQALRNQSAHHWSVKRDDAIYCLGKLAEITHWYFVDYLRETAAAVDQAERSRQVESGPDLAAGFLEVGPAKTPARAVPTRLLLGAFLAVCVLAAAVAVWALARMPAATPHAGVPVPVPAPASVASADAPEPPARPSGVITSLRDEARVRRAVGKVVTGWRVRLKDKTVRDDPYACGACFAVDARGHFVTSGHLLKPYQEGVRATDRDQVVKSWLKSVVSSIGDGNPLRQDLPKLEKMLLTLVDAVEDVKPMVWVFLADDRESPYEAEVAYVSTSFDLAVLTLKVKNPPYFALVSSSGEVSRGLKVTALGFNGDFDPGAGAIRKMCKASELEYNLTDGVISRTSVLLEDTPLVRHTATIALGSAGGPLLLEDGRVAGINLYLYEGGFYALPTADAFHEIKPYLGP